MAFSIRKLSPHDDRSSFRSGDIDLDRFFARYAGQNQFRHHIGTTYVAVDHAGAIVGFATVAPSELSPETLSATKHKRLPKYPLPVLRLARLAVDERAKGKGVGSLLLRAAFALVMTMADDLGLEAWRPPASSRRCGTKIRTRPWLLLLPLGRVQICVERGHGHLLLRASSHGRQDL